MTTVDRTLGPDLQAPPAAPANAQRACLPLLPRLPGTLAPRPHLTRRLDRLAAITAVDALPGFGGRTLVAAWAHAQRAAGSHVVWLDGIPGEEDVDFRNRLRLALVQSGALAPEAGTELADWIPALARCGRPVVIVVTGAPWLLTGRSAERLLTVTGSVHTVHLVLLDTGAQTFSETARRRGADVQAIRSSDLALSPEEVRTFASAWGYELDAATAHDLGSRLSGWILPLRLVLEATPAGAEIPAFHAAHDFVRDEILPDVLVDEELAAALRLSVPRSVDLALAEALLSDLDRDVPALLDGLERRDLLWRQPAATGRPRWRFPAVVRSALLDRCAEDDAGHRRARQTTARILTCRGETDLDELVEHACAAGDRGLLAELWTEHGWALLGTDLPGFVRAYDRTDGVAGDAPGGTDDALLVPAALADASRRMPPEADWLTRTETLMRRYTAAGERFLAEPSAVGPGSAQQVDLLTAAMVAHRGEGALTEAVRMADELDRAIRARRTATGRELASQASWGWVQAAVTHLHAGRYGEAHRLAMAANDAAPRSLPGEGAAALLGLLAASTGDRDEAERWLARSDADDDTSWGARLAGLPARLARAQLALDRLDPVTAAEHLADSSLSSDTSGMLPIAVAVHTRHALLFGEPVAMLARLDQLALLADRRARTRSGLWRHVFDRSTADLLLALGEVDRARSLLGGDAVDVPPWLVASAARFHLITGDPLAAARAARAGVWNEAVHARDRMELLVCGARALHSLGRTGEALEDLRRAHGLGRHVGSLEPYLLLGEQRGALLAEAGLRLAEEDEAALDATQPVYPASATFVRLTPRELVVLTEMARHETAAAVARTLSVSVNTVKKQMVSIYAKLGVHERGAALIRARRLGLLPAPGASTQPRSR